MSELRDTVGSAATIAADAGGVALLLDWTEPSRKLLEAGGAGPDAEALVAIALRYGRLAAARAYGDWARPEVRGAADALYRAGIEPVYVPAASGDREGLAARTLPVRLAIDAASLCNQQQIGTFVLVTGDADLVPLLQVLPAHGKRVVTVTADDQRYRQVAGVDTALAYAVASPSPVGSSKGQQTEPRAGALGQSETANKRATTANEGVTKAPVLQSAAAAPPVVAFPPNLTRSPTPTLNSTPQLTPSMRTPATRPHPAPSPVLPAPPAAGRLWVFDGSGASDGDAVLAQLQSIVHESVLPPNRALSLDECRDEMETLRLATLNLNERWGGFSSEVQRALLGLYATRARYLQRQEQGERDLSVSLAIERVFRLLTAFSADHRPGWINGLQHDHAPERESWLADARDWYEQLRSSAGLASEPGGERRQLLEDVSGAVSTWIAAPPERRRACVLDVETMIRRCFQNGIAKRDPKLVQMVLPILGELKAKDFKTLREAAKDMQEQARLADQRHANGVSPERKRKFRSCCDEECKQLAVVLAGSEALAITEEPSLCDVCAGSRDQRAARAVAQQLKSNRIARLLVVGGTPRKWTRLGQLFDDSGIELRHVDGLRESYSKADAEEDKRWTDLVVVWGGTPLAHKVSNLYRRSGQGDEDLRIVTVGKTGIEALCREVMSRIN